MQVAVRHPVPQSAYVTFDYLTLIPSVELEALEGRPGFESGSDDEDEDDGERASTDDIGEMREAGKGDQSQSQ